MHYIEVYFCQQSEFGDSADSSSIQASFQIKTKIKFPTACVGSVRGHHNRRTVQENQKLRRLEISWGIWRQDATLMRDKPRGERHPRDCTSIFFGSTFLLLLYLFPPLTLVIVHIVHVVYIRGGLHYTPYTFKKKSRVLYIFQFFIIVLC